MKYLNLLLHKSLLSLKAGFFSWLEEKKPEKEISGTGHPYFYYREGDHIAAVTAEWTIGNPAGDIVLYPISLLTWMPPYDNEAIPKEKKSEIMNKIDRYLRLERKISYDIEENSEEEDRLLEKIKNGGKIYW